MISNKFQPGWVVTTLTMIALAVLIGLGSWQASKIGPKTKLIDKIETGLTGESLALPVHLDTPVSEEYKRFYFKGTVHNGIAAKVFAPNTKGKSGYHLYLPVKHQFGRWVMVNWGWIPFDYKGLPELPLGQEVNISGVLLTNPKAGSFTPENQPGKNTWYLADIFQLFDHFKLDEFYHFRIVADHQAHLGEFPLGGQVRVDIPNDHFEYMLTWYGLALGLIGVYVAFGIRRSQTYNEDKQKTE
ncbi:SURF1 family protein [Kordiimonas sp. SCSIO 12610]|uniref:SURF1 family protein n=1 Tax=Kordiimonas sp. SCSIO 12610 TaxID=2829597 RepID=UPI00210E05D6|nr:SURF1 family cytochrome oxidase biogenesis protein [Kordiimonas sp. SCSIO 12610]UTW54907.1 hypothetical protein KFF44_14020 [Kordiimonas sp. SCSIO 12610]